jgi:ribose transport system substrate-binding protein
METGTQSPGSVAPDLHPHHPFTQRKGNTVRTTRKAGAAIAAASALLILLSGCAPTVATSTDDSAEDAPAAEVLGEKTFDITTLCGDDPIKIALTDGSAGHTWRKIVLAEFEAEAAKCPNITDVLYSDAGGDPQKAAADISGFVAQGVNVIVTLPDFGDAQLPSIREAYNAGVTIVPYYNKIAGAAGTDYSDNLYVANYGIGEQMAEWYGENLDEGNIIALGGTASCTSCTELFQGLQDGLKAYPNLTLLGETFVATDYSPETAQRAVAGLINQYGEIAGMTADYGLVAGSGLQAFTAAGLPTPMVAIANGQNSVYCLYSEAEAAGDAWKFAAWEGGTQVVRAALRRALADYNKIDFDEPTSVTFPKVIDTADGVLPPACDTSLPDDADMFSLLTSSEMATALS